MKIHIVRHAEAIDRSSVLPDGHRYLTCRGRTRFRRVAATLRKWDIDPDLIITSPLIRAVQTAEILAETLRFAGELSVHPPLATDFSMARFRELVASVDQAKELVIVGHEPDLGTLVGDLLDQSPCTLMKGGVVSIKFKPSSPEHATTLLWLVTGGGKLVTDYDAVVKRLTGRQSAHKEE